MAATTKPIPSDREIDERLDELIPPSTSPLRALLTSGAIVGAAIAITVLTIGGYLYPRPTFGGSFSSNTFLEVDQARDAVSGTVSMPNYGHRSVRITDIELDAPGAEVVEVGVVLEPLPTDGSSARPWTPRNEAVLPLPVTVAPGQWAELVIWYRPTECNDQPGPWGIARPTVDFGDGAFPPARNTFTIDQDPIAIVDLEATAENGGDTVDVMLPDGSLFSAVGPLSAACEALR